jgi:HJR/Mrr/RecB family endonuclease
MHLNGTSSRLDVFGHPGPEPISLLGSESIPGKLIKYFTWSTATIDDLRSAASEVLGRHKNALDAALERETDDGGDRVQTLGFRREVNTQLASWRSHFDLKLDDLPDYDPQKRAVHSWRLHFDAVAIVSNLVRGISGAAVHDSDSRRIYRPKILEHANHELMAYLRSKPEHVDNVHHRTFESIVAEVMRDKGYSVELTKHTRDGGYDVMCVKSDECGFPILLLIECKLFDLRRSVGLPMIDRVMGAVSRQGATGGIVVTNSRFTQSAWRRWEHRIGRDLHLVDRMELLEWLKSYGR